VIIDKKDIYFMDQEINQREFSKDRSLRRTSSRLQSHISNSHYDSIDSPNKSEAQ
jgi:hypothetical protein